MAGARLSLVFSLLFFPFSFLSFFFFTPIHLLNAERVLGFERRGVDFACPAGPNALFSLFSPFFFPAPVLLFRSSRRRERIWFFAPHSHRRPSTTAEGLILWRVWGKADINVAGARIEPRDRGEPQPVKNTVDLSPVSYQPMARPRCSANRSGSSPRSVPHHRNRSLIRHSSRESYCAGRGKTHR